MAPGYRYAIAALLSVLLIGGFVTVYRAGEVAGASHAVPIVIRPAAPAPATTVQGQSASTVSAVPPPMPPETPAGLATPSIDYSNATSAPVGRSTHRHGHSSGRTAANKLKWPGEGTVNVNTASAEELQRLPGVGPKMAERIIDYRTQVSGFRSADDLTNVQGIGEKKLAKMAPFLRF